MARYKVFYKGYFIIDADDVDEAMNADIDDYGVSSAEWENLYAEEIEE